MVVFDASPTTFAYTAEHGVGRIDAIAPPGISINPADNSFANPASVPAVRHRPR